MIYLFNELSLSQLSSRVEVQRILESFVKATIHARKLGLNEIRLHESTLSNFYNLPLLENYKVDDWLNDNTIDYDLRESFHEILTSTPLIKDDELYEHSLFQRSEFHIIDDGNKHPVFGLGAAFLLNTFAISLATHKKWLPPTITVNHYSIDDDVAENLVSIEVSNFADRDTLEVHRSLIENQQKEILEKSSDLWAKRTEYFPNILLGIELEAQLKKIGLSKKFDLIFDSLKKLDEYGDSWNNGGFDLNKLRAMSKLDISGESPTTMNRFSVLRKFKLSNGGSKQQFELHIKLPDIRIYFLPNDATREITIGYIGKHLRTALHK